MSRVKINFCYNCRHILSLIIIKYSAVFKKQLLTVLEINYLPNFIIKLIMLIAKWKNRRKRYQERHNKLLNLCNTELQSSLSAKVQTTQLYCGF